MSLLRLLTAGRSLVTVRDAESRYRLTTQRFLPQFAPTKNPFSSKREAESASALANHRDAATGTALPGIDGWGFARALWLRAAAVWNRRKKRPNGLVARPRGAAVKPAIPQFGRPPVQRELSLDQVKVVRNDLSEADLEVVPAKPKAAPARWADELAGGAGNAWERVAPRVFHAGKQ